MGAPQPGSPAPRGGVPHDGWYVLGCIADDMSDVSDVSPADLAPAGPARDQKLRDLGKATGWALLAVLAAIVVMAVFACSSYGG